VKRAYFSKDKGSKEHIFLKIENKIVIFFVIGPKLQLLKSLGIKNAFKPSRKQRK